MNPNGRIPVLVDKSKENFSVFETSAILLYLTDHYDKNRVFSFDPTTDPKNYSEMVQWMFFTVSDVILSFRRVSLIVTHSTVVLALCKGNVRISILSSIIGHS